jgi:thioesterase domain-containing protein
MPSERFVAFGYSPERDLPPEEIVPLNATGTGTPIVLFAGIHGFAPFADTLRAIGQLFEAPLSAVKFPFHLEAVPSVETLAAPYPARIEARFGTAPCVIAGYSIGCVIAYEVGRRMIERGRPVRMLLLFDGFAPRRKRRKATGRARALFHLERFRRASWEDRARMVVRHTLGGLIRRLERRLLRHLNAGIARRLQLEDQDRSFWWEVGSLAVRYQPRSNFPGPMLLIASEEESPRYSHSEEEWRAAAVQPLEILRVPNPHIGFFEHPHMADLMQVLNPRLRK